MQLCCVGNNSGSSVPLIFASPSSKQKLLLLERRLTGSDTLVPATSTPLQMVVPTSDRPIEDPHNLDGGVVVAPASQQHSDMDVQVVGSLEPPAQQSAGSKPAAVTPDLVKSGSTCDTLPATSVSKRRKTAKPQHRPPSDNTAAAAGHDSAAGKAAAAAAPHSSVKDTVQRDRTPKHSRTSPRADFSSVAGDVANSNPPASPVLAAAGEQHGECCPFTQVSFICSF
jgi:hypothetical protein